ncbi:MULTISPECIES: glycosyltransferase [unclassified Roseofilum]|uniref:glycosyltransferase n=1 Tax=unclassified Roseofilum TaxID=2620099 RepID=UPI000E9FE6AC|nr:MULTISPECIES: glycosyltransferase [unclassified Roseofilum]MBP0007240.1 glycosyltransferase [Roseofilum sp. Belize Diploria]MBP0031883.1 glycosyltransferase [Roseofilum sp. Belize BBD 4]HBQ99986.1 glycosyl transferase group 1 [Cyanobacteria bacterium UBA11691]
MDIFVFLEIFSLEGGIQSYVKDILSSYTQLCAQDPDQRAEVYLLRDKAGCDNPFEGEPGLKFYYFKKEQAWLGRIHLASTLFLHLLQKRPRRVFCGHVYLAHLIQLLCKPLGIPYTVLTYGKEVWEPLAPKYYNALQKAEWVWTISRYSRDRTSINNQVDRQKFELLPCAIDGDVFTPGPKNLELVQTYQLESAKVLMTVARLWSGDIYKGVDVTIRALPKIAHAIPDVKYLVIGRGDDRPRLEQLAEDLGVSDRIVFAGFVPDEALVDHYRLADAYIMPSQEGFGIVYLEAMACGVPVLSGDNDGSADPLEDGRLGWQVPYRDPEAVATACIEILQGGDRRCDGSWLREQALSGFGKPAFTQRLAQLLHN